jgi:hypothetical protein
MSIDILSKTILNEKMMKDNLVPLFVLSAEEELYLKNINKDIRNNAYEVPNAIEAILITDGEVKMRIWNMIESFISQNIGCEIKDLLIGTCLSSTKKTTVHLHTVQWIISRLHEQGAKFKIYQNQKIIKGANIYPVETLRESFMNVDFYFDFEFLRIPKDINNRYKDVIFSFIK